MQGFSDSECESMTGYTYIFYLHEMTGVQTQFPVYTSGNEASIIPNETPYQYSRCSPEIATEP